MSSIPHQTIRLGRRRRYFLFFTYVIIENAEVSIASRAKLIPLRMCCRHIYKAHLHEQFCLDKEKLLVSMENSGQIFLVKENLAC